MCLGVSCYKKFVFAFVVYLVINFERKIWRYVSFKFLSHFNQEALNL